MIFSVVSPVSTLDVYVRGTTAIPTIGEVVPEPINTPSIQEGTIPLWLTRHINKRTRGNNNTPNFVEYPSSYYSEEYSSENHTVAITFGGMVLGSNEVVLLHLNGRSESHKYDSTCLITLFSTPTAVWNDTQYPLTGSAYTVDGNLVITLDMVHTGTTILDVSAHSIGSLDLTTTTLISYSIY